MLKPPTEPGPEPADNERPIEDGKAYARAEVGVMRAMAAAKADALKLPAILFGAAFVLLLASVTALA